MKQEGFTLMEVLITIALIGILSVPISQILLTSQKIFYMNEDMLNDKSVALQIEEIIRKEVQLAQNIRLEGELEHQEASFLIDRINGYDELILQQADQMDYTYFGKDFWGDRKINLEFSLDKGSEEGKYLPIVKLYININDGDYIVNTSIKIETLSRLGNEISSSISKSNQLIFSK